MFDYFSATSLAMLSPSDTSHNLVLDLINPTNWSSNLSLPSYDTAITYRNSTLSLPTVLCDGETYKSNLLSASCLDAFHTIPSNVEELSFGDREDGDFDVPLPYRWVSCECLDSFSVSLPCSSRG